MQLTRDERRALKSRRRRDRERTAPSPSAAAAWLERFHDPATPPAVAGRAFIPAVTEQLQSLWRTNQTPLWFMQRQQPATPDMDATLVETLKRDALPCHKAARPTSR